MSKVFSPPQEIGNPPEISGGNFDFTQYQIGCDTYVNQIVEWAKKHGDGEYAGKEIRFGVADGTARYIILSLNPVKLIHVSTMDAYQFPYVHRLTAGDIKKLVKHRDELARLFGVK